MRAYLVAVLLIGGCLADRIDGGDDDPPSGEVDQASSTPALTLAKTYVTDGNIRAAVTDGKTLYIGGAFHYVGSRSGELALVSASTGTRSTFPAIGGGEVATILPDGQGGYFFGGDFRKVGSLSTRALAHLKSDGTWDAAWKFQINGVVGALARDSSRLYVGGSFGLVNGQTRRNLAVFDLATGALLSPAPNINLPVSSLALSGTRLFVGLNGADGASPTGALMRLDLPAMTVSSWNPGMVDGPVYSLLAYGSGLYVGGAFTHVGSYARGHVASIDQTTAAVRPYNPNTNDAVATMQRLGSILYLAGEFTTVGGQPRERVAAVDASTGALLSFHPDTTGLGAVGALLATSSAVYVGGNIAAYDKIVYSYAFDPATGARLAWNPNPNGAVAVIVPHPNGLLLGGAFTSTNGSTRHNLAAIDLATGKATSWAPATDSDPNSSVAAMALSGSTVYIAGTFSTLGGQPRANFGAVSTSGALLPLRADTNGHVSALAMIGSTVYLGGGFTQVAGSSRIALAAVDGSSGALRSWNPGVSTDDAYALQPVGSTLYVGGAGFRLSAFDATTGAVKPAPSTGEVDSLAYDGTYLYVGGFYDSIGGVSRNSLAAVVPNTTTVTSWNPALPQYRRIATLATTGSYVYAEDYGTIHTLSKSSGALQTFSPRVVNSRINSIIPLSDRLLLLGGFHDIDYIAQENVAEYMGTP